MDEYRIKAEKEGNYTEANIASEKFDELTKKESSRQLILIQETQVKEAETVENAQKKQFMEFSNAWDKYVSEYESTALQSLEHLKARHNKEIEELREKLKTELKVKMKFSKGLLEIRDKEQALMKLRQYSDANQVKLKADALEAKERSKLQKKD